MKILYLPPGRKDQLRLTERAIRDELAHLIPGHTLTTTELIKRIAGDQPEEMAARKAAYNNIRHLEKHLTQLYDIVPIERQSGMYAGRTVNAKVWHHIDSPDMPPEPPAGTPSTGAASSVRRIDPALDALARRVERIERFLVLEPIGEGK